MLGLAEPPRVATRPWLAAYDPGVPATLDYPAVTLDELLRRSALRFPSRSALVFFGRSTTYAAFDTAVDRVAAGLRGLGLRSGERVALFMPNCPQLVIAFYAVWRTGCVVVPLNPKATAAEVQRYLADSGAAAAMVLDQLWDAIGRVELPKDVRVLVAADLADDLPAMLGAVVRGRRLGSRLRRVARRRQAGRPNDADTGFTAVRFSRLSRAVSPSHASDRTGPAVPLVGPDGPATLLFTGGTTGLPKAAILSHRNLVANACQVGAWAASLDEGDEVMLSALPLAHGYAMTSCMNVSVLRGWTQVLVADPRDIERLIGEIERRQVTVFPGVPTLYAAVCAHPSVRSGRRSLRSIEACISGAATLPNGTQWEFERLSGGHLVEGYGLTEASPATHCNPIGSGGRSDTIGLPLPDTDCQLVDVETESTVVDAAGPGVLCISGPQVMTGYWQRPDDTAHVLRVDDDGRTWLHTGDVAEMSPDGYFRIVDRKKDIIVAAGGLKVYPNEIEEILSTHPKVHLCAVIGVPVGGADQRAKAFVVLRSGDRADAEEILMFLGANLASYKVPKSIEFRRELPLAFTGKVLRRVLADEERAREAGGDGPAGTP